MTGRDIRRPLLAALAATTLAAGPATLAAQDRHLAFELGGGLAYAPAYEGSDEYSSTPSFQGSLQSLGFGSMALGGGDATGFGIAPSFGYVGARDSSDYDELKGMDDVDWTVEVGLKAKYTWDSAEVSAAVRKGFNGHEGVVADLAADAILRPDARTTIRVGPRLSLANDEYADTYFSVPAAARNLSAYSAEGGLKSVGAEISARRELTDIWSIEGSLGYERLTNDFEDSPVTRAGSRDQVRVGVSLIRQFDWRF
ncbi:MipA/OmpV family protein [Marinovum sp.]|uniref:MipA/OmpV family protein n=1 Tax=Marinovum sp. TaxID=2024839 RepID=UPI002B26F595|nr:MipA/OmpV family protein [Marinovum sp.]